MREGEVEEALQRMGLEDIWQRCDGGGHFVCFKIWAMMLGDLSTGLAGGNIWQRL